MTKLRTATAICLLALSVGAFAACGDDEEDTAGTAPASTTPTADTAATTPQGGNEVKVSMVDIKFKPESATVKSGQKVVWTNDDPVAHTVTATKGAKFDSGTVDPGGKYEQTFDKPGTVDYVCTIHPNQKGNVTVE